MLSVCLLEAQALLLQTLNTSLEAMGPDSEPRGVSLPVGLGGPYM